MMTAVKRFSLGLLGPFRLLRPEGERIEVPSKKGVAVVAMLAMAKDGERTRGWLQDKLWGARQHDEARGSLRRELSNLRRLLNQDTEPLLICEHDRVKLRLELIDIDARRVPDHPLIGEFLEGLDISGEDGFEEWLREQRGALAREARTPETPQFAPGKQSQRAPMPLPPHFVDTSLPPAGFNGSPAVAVMLGSTTPPLSIVVLPFQNISGDPAQEYFVDGVTESLTTDLSRIVGSFVIGRNTAFTYKGEALDLKQVGRELNVRYVLQGSVQRAGDRFRVNAQLVDTETGAYLWAERFDKPIGDLFELQDEIASRLANQLETQLTEQEARRSERSPHPSSVELYFQGRALLNKGWTFEHLAQARCSFERALAVDSKNIDAVVGTAMIDLIVGSTHMSDDGAALLAKAEVTLMRVLSLAPNHALAHLLLGAVLISTKRAAQSLAECERALALDRNLAEAHAQIGAAKQVMGREAETEAHVKEAFRLSPRDVFAHRWFFLIGTTKLLLNEDTEALDWLLRSVEANRNYPIAHFALAATLALLGSLDQARTAARAGLAINPSFTIRRYRDGALSDHPTYLAKRERICQGMRVAGIPDG